MLLKLHQLAGNSVQDLEVSDTVFGISEINKYAIAQVVRWQLHKRREILSRAKTRSEVKGSGKKIYRQKGTGNARHSDKYAPQFRKGGVAHGPKGTKSVMDVPKKVRRLALRHALSGKASQGQVVVFDSLSFDEIKTKKALEVFAAFDNKKVLFVDQENGVTNFSKSISNIIGFDYIPVVGLNVYDILQHDVIVIAKDALQKIEERVA